MTDQAHHQQTSDSSTIRTAYRWLATVFAALVVVQAFLGTRGFFADQDLIDVHAIVANTMFLLAIIQTVLAWLLYTRNQLTMRDVVLNAVLVLLTVAQIGLGYSTREADSFANTISLHIPNGVLMMGVSSALAAMAWRSTDDRPTTMAHS